MSSERAGTLEGVLLRHVIVWEPRAYPAYECECGDWNGALGDNGGSDDGCNDNQATATAHVAAEVRAWLAGVLDETTFMEALGTEARKYANQRRTINGPLVWSVTLAELPTVATAALTAVADLITHPESAQEASDV